MVGGKTTKKEKRKRKRERKGVGAADRSRSLGRHGLCAPLKARRRMENAAALLLGRGLGGSGSRSGRLAHGLALTTNQIQDFKALKVYI